MLANNILQIRIPLTRDLHGNLLNFEKIEERGILSQQVGIFYDDDGKSLSFKGTIVSSENQSLRIFKSWIEGQKDYVTNDDALFQKFWELDTERLEDNESFSEIHVRTIPLTQALKEKFLKYTPHSKEEIKLIKPPKLFDYQIDAVNNWISKNGNGIFEMATGTGKTFTAIGCLEAISKVESSFWS